MHQINLIIGILQYKAVITEDEAEALAKELSQTIIPTDFHAALRIVKSVFDDVEQKAAKEVEVAAKLDAELKAEKSPKK